ncbi:helix-turn-helix domain-containing protein [Paenibacillus sp. 1P07SE]|uniref:helix-turn-helix domain-containing protein n=1 Tax=Paenibacillus sp. 1P07SE TaxID=3132209 RepID=UPI0039A71B3E
MKKRWTSGRDAIVIRFLGPYLVIMLVPLLIGMLVYDKTVTVVKEEVVQTNMTVLEQARDILDSRLYDIEMNIQQLASNHRVQSFQHVNTPFQGVNPYRIMETRKELFEYALVNRFLVDYFVLFKNSGVAMSSTATYKLSEFYDGILTYDMDYTSWYEQYLGQYRKTYMPAESVSYKGRPYSLLTYVQTMGNASYFNGAIIALIDNHEIKKMLSGVNIGNGGWAYIMDRQGEVISYISDEQAPRATIPIPEQARSGMLEPTEATGHMMVTYTTSSFNGWTYVAVQPPHIVMEKVNYIHQYAFIMLLIMVAAGIGISLYLAYRSSKPIRHLHSLIAEKMGVRRQTPRDAFGYIQQSFSELWHHNETLSDKIKQQLPFIRAAFFERLLRGEFKTMPDLQASMAHAGIRMEGSGYTVVLIQIRGYEEVTHPELLEELDIKRIIATEAFESVFGSHGYLFDTGDDKIAMMVTLDSTDAQACTEGLKSQLAEIDQAALQKHGVWVTCGVGRCYASPLAIASAYEDARHALSFRRDHDRVLALWYHELPLDNNNYYYPADVETRLMNYARAGERESMEHLLAELYRENEERHLSIAMLRLWFYEMWGTAAKLMDHFESQLEIDGKDGSVYIQQMFSRVGDLEDVREMFAAFTSVLTSMCDIVDKRKKSHNHQLKIDILDMMASGFDDPDFCLDLVADRFQMSAKYLSQFFKEQTGTNFSDHLNSLRMEQARKLLQETELSVHEITLRSGYHSMNVFSRAFKRNCGMSPTVYRRSIK